MKPTTLAAAIAGGACVILRGPGRSYSPGAVAFRLSYLPERGIDPPDVAGFFQPVVWRDGNGWTMAPEYRPGRAVGLHVDELVSVIE